MNDDVYEKPDEFSPKQIQDLIDKIGEQQGKSDDQQIREKDVNDDLDKRIEEVKKLCANNQACSKLKAKGKEIAKEMKGDIKAIKDLLDKLPDQIDNMLNSLEE